LSSLTRRLNLLLIRALALALLLGFRVLSSWRPTLLALRRASSSQKRLSEERRAPTLLSNWNTSITGVSIAAQTIFISWLKGYQNTLVGDNSHQKRTHLNRLGKDPLYLINTGLCTFPLISETAPEPSERTLSGWVPRVFCPPGRTPPESPHGLPGFSHDFEEGAQLIVKMNTISQIPLYKRIVQFDYTVTPNGITVARKPSDEKRMGPFRNTSIGSFHLHHKERKRDYSVHPYWFGVGSTHCWL